MAEGLLIHQFEVGPWENFIYFIGDKASRTVAVVDPAWDLPTILAEAERLDVRISHVLCTHSHFDHVNRVDELLQTHDIPVHMLRPEVEFSGFRCENLVASSPGETLEVGEHVEITMMHTPGHTPGSTSYRVRDGIVTGDTMFVDGCGRCDLVGGDPKLMHATLHGLYDKLPGNTVMYPGHNYGETPTATLDDQLQSNPFLKLPTLEEFVAHRMKGRTPNTELPPAPEWPQE